MAHFFTRFPKMHQLRPLFLIIWCCLLLTGLAAEGRYEFTPAAREAYEKVISLRFEEARTLLFRIKYEDPDNLIVYHIENYIDFFTIFINENEAEFRQLERNKAYRLEKLAQGDRNSPYYLYTQAEIKLQWALARLKFEEYFTAFSEVKAAYKQLTRNQKKYPNFVANKKSLGILHAIIGTIPDNYKWGVKVLGGMQGTIEQGRREIQEVLDYAKQNDFIFEEETLVMYAFLLMYLKNQEAEAWEMVHSGVLNPRANPLACFVLVNVAMRAGRNDEAIQLLEQRPSGEVYLPFPYLDYLLGLAKLHRLDADADRYFERYLDRFRGQNYIKLACQKLAWFHFLQGDEAAYRRWMKACQKRGAKVIDGDEHAEREAESGQLPHPSLLRARLLFDGGYYQRAYEVLQNESVNRFERKAFALEYTYRLGRVTHKLGRLDEAVAHYRITIDQGRSERWFYACNAALQIGIIMESQGQLDEAGRYFEQCLEMRPQTYRNSLHQKAKAGLDRIKR